MWPFSSVRRADSESLRGLLTEVARRLSESDNISWEGLSPAEASMDLKIAIEHLEEKEEIDLRHLQVLFAPTGLIQECAIANGWGDDFLKLAQQFDEEVQNKC